MKDAEKGHRRKWSGRAVMLTVKWAAILAGILLPILLLKPSFLVQAGVWINALSDVFYRNAYLPDGYSPGAYLPGEGADAAAEKLRWSVGDTVIRELGGESFRFRCIDENYSDGMEYRRQAALFLCDKVIPANFGSRYEFETPDDKEHGYVFYPGPVVNFGTSNDYKYSAVRNWFRESETAMGGAEPVNTGVFRAYTGSTPEMTRGEMLTTRNGGDTLKGSDIGSQKMVDRLFILSVDEAIKYRDRLWCFEGADEENPESQYGPFCKGYWLRTPVGTGENFDTAMVYIVDLVHGNIRPAGIAPLRSEGEQDKEDAELQVTGTTGVRPAFVLPQH